MIINRLFRTKSVQKLITETIDPQRLMKKRLSAIDLVAFGIGATIGSGIFALTGTAAAGQVASAGNWWSTPIINFMLNCPLGRLGAGPAISISFILAAIACAFTAFCYAELASMIPVSGSAYTFAYASLGEIVAWIIGWDLILEYAVGNVAVAVSWSDYFLYLFHGVTGLKMPLWLTCDTTTALSKLSQIGSGSMQHMLYSSTYIPNVLGHSIAINLPALAIVALITWVLVVGIHESSIVNLIMVVVKVSIVLFFIIYGTAYINPSNWIPFAPNGLAGIAAGAAIVFFSFIGFDAVSSMAEETKNPKKDLPIGILGSLVVCTILYALVSLVLTGILPYKSYMGDAAPVATAIASIPGPLHGLAQITVALGALAGMTSVLLVFQLGQPRIFMAMSRDGLLPKFFAKLHPKYRTPFIPTILTGLIVGISALFLDIGQAAELTNIGTLAAFIIVCGGVLVLRKKDTSLERHFYCPFVPIVPILGILACLFLMLSLPLITWFRFILWMAFGMVIYVMNLLKKSSPTSD